MFGSKRRVAFLRSPPLLIAVVNRKNLPTDHNEVTIYLNPQKINPLLEKSWLKKYAGDARLLRILSQAWCGQSEPDLGLERMAIIISFGHDSCF